MKVVKTTLIVIATLIGVGIVLFFGTAFFSAGVKVSADKDHWDNVHQEESIDALLGPFKKADSGKMVTIDSQMCESNAVCTPVQLTADNNSDILGKVVTGDKVKVLDIDCFQHKVFIKHKHLKGWIDYYAVAEFKSVALKDTLSNKK